MFLGGGSSLLAVMLGAGAALAAPVSTPFAVTVEFNAPPGCSSADAFNRALEARTTGLRLLSGRDTNPRLQVRITRAGAGQRARGEIRIVDEQGQTDTRDVEGASCAEVTEVLALTAALALERMAEPHAAATGRDLPNQSADGTAAGGDGSQTSATDATEKRTTSGAPDSAERAKKKPKAEPDAESGATKEPSRGAGLRNSLEFALTGHATLSQVLPPEPNLGGEVGLRVAGPRGPSLGLGLSYSTNGAFSRDPDLKVGWLNSTASACPFKQEIAAIFAIEPCAQASFGWLWVRHDLVDNPRTASRSWWSVGALLRARAGSSRGVSIELEGGVTYALVRRRFVVEPNVRTWETARFSPIAKLGFVLAF